MFPVKIDLIELERLYREGAGMKQLAKHFSVRVNAVHKRLHTLGIVDSNRSPKSKVNTLETLELYSKGWGYQRLARKYGVDQKVIRRRVVRAGITEPSRQFLATGRSRRQRRPRSCEFSNLTKRLRFEQENGICEECKTPISSWDEATFHHVILASQGGSNKASNCMVLHETCHNDPETFLKLHGFLYTNIIDRCIGPATLNQEKSTNDEIRSGLDRGLTVSALSRMLGVDRSGLSRRISRLIRNEHLIPTRKWTKTVLLRETSNMGVDASQLL